MQINAEKDIMNHIKGNGGRTVDEKMNEIVKADSCERMCVNKGKLKQYTNQIPLHEISADQWSRAEHLYIIGSVPEHNGMHLFGNVRCYSDSSGTWFLVEDAAAEQVQRIISSCSDWLKKLDIRFALIERLELSHLSGLRWLQMVGNRRLSEIAGLDRLNGLEVLSINNTAVGETLDVSALTALRRLKLQDMRQLHRIEGLQAMQNLERLHLGQLGLKGSLELNRHPRLTHLMLGQLPIHNIRLREPLTALRVFCISGGALDNAEFVCDMPCIEELILLRTQVMSLPDLSCCPGLKLLDVSGSPIAHMGGLPAGIQYVILSGTKLRQIPAFFRNLTELKRLYLKHLNLEEFPSWLPELGLRITVEEFAEGDCITLENTLAKGADLSDIRLLRNGDEKDTVINRKIHCWFASRGRAVPDCVSEYAADESVLDFQMQFDRLPGAFFTRLWAELWQETDTNYIWETGVRFVQPDTQMSAVICGANNTLRFLVRRSDKYNRLYAYFSHIRNTAERIAGELEMRSGDARFMYKVNGETYPVEDMMIKMCLVCPGMLIPLPGLLHPVSVDDIVNQNNPLVDKDREALLEHLISLHGDMQKKEIYRGKTEDDYTDVVENMLTSAGYVVFSQPRGGTAGSNTGTGRVDLKIRKKDEPNREWTLYEALRLYGSGQSQLDNLDEHLKRVMDNYNPLGLPFVFLVSYVQCEMGKFGEVYRKCSGHLSQYMPEGYRLLTHKDMTLALPGYGQNEFLRVVQCSYERDGFERVVYFIFARFDKPQKSQDQVL